MKNENWSTTKSKIYVSSKLPESPASGYARPEIKRVAVEIEGDDEDFIPSYADGVSSASLLANLPSGKIRLTKGSSIVVDCGFSVEMPPGYRCVVSSEEPGLFLTLIDSKRLKVHALNLGDNLVLSHKQIIGKIWIEPVYFFEWIMKG